MSILNSGCLGVDLPSVNALRCTECLLPVHVEPRPQVVCAQALLCVCSFSPSSDPYQTCDVIMNWPKSEKLVFLELMILP